MDDDDSAGSLLTRKLGPLPTWQWLAILTAIGIAVYFLVSKKKTKAATADSSDSTETTTTSEADVPQFVIENMFPPSSPSATATSTTTVNNPVTTTTQPPPTVTKPTSPTKAATKAPAKTTGHTVTVTKWTSKNTPWSSTISGIAAHYGVRNWKTVWNAPQNAALRSKRKNNPALIQPGDKVYVPA